MRPTRIRENIMKTKVNILSVVYIVLTFALCMTCNVACVPASTGSSSSSSSESSSVVEDNTTETVYQGSRGSEIRLCDNGIAYINGTKGTWRKASVTIGNTSHDYIQIDQNGYIEQGAICEGKFYYGRNAHFAVKEGYPDGESLTRSRR